MATLPDRVYAKPLRCGSRKRDHGFTVYLEGSSPRRSQHDRDAYAATWDEWGIWIAALYDIDPEAIIGQYSSRERLLRHHCQVEATWYAGPMARSERDGSHNEN